MPPGKAYGFVEFASHDAAKAAFSLLDQPDAPLQVRWGKARPVPAEDRPKRPRFEADSRKDCWFCLASPTCETHLVGGIATEVYLTLPKGGLTPHHVLLVPINHVGSQVDLSPTELRELYQFKTSLARFFYQGLQGSGMVVFERFADTKGTYHMHQQIVPVDPKHLRSVVDIFKQEGRPRGMRFAELPVNDPEAALPDEPGNEHYFFVEFWLPDEQGAAGAPTNRLVYRCAPGSRIPIQFGREVMANLMGAPERGHWKACQVPKDEEARMTEAFKQEFAPYDSTQAQ